MSDLERAVEAGSWAETMEHGRVGPRIAEAVLQAALAAGEIVLADVIVELHSDLDVMGRTLQDTAGGYDIQQRRAGAAEQALVLANQDAQRLANLVRTVTFMGEDYWELEQENALAAHDLRVAQQEGT